MLVSAHLPILTAQQTHEDIRSLITCTANPQHVSDLPTAKTSINLSFHIYLHPFLPPLQNPFSIHFHCLLCNDPSRSGSDPICLSKLSTACSTFFHPEPSQHSSLTPWAFGSLPIIWQYRTSHLFFLKLSCRIYSNVTSFSANYFFCSRIESRILNGIELSCLLSPLRSVMVPWSRHVFHYLDTFEGYSSVTLLEVPSMWVCLVFFQDQIKLFYCWEEGYRGDTSPQCIPSGARGVTVHHLRC